MVTDEDENSPETLDELAEIATFAINVDETAVNWTSRDRWFSQKDFYFAIVSYSVNQFGMFRFAYVCLKNDGGEFLVPYSIVLFAVILPALYLELALGQHQQVGCIELWNMVPMLKGIGWAACTLNVYIVIVCNLSIVYAAHYFIKYLQLSLQWTECNGDWNFLKCITDNSTLQKEFKLNNPILQKHSDSFEVFMFNVFGISTKNQFNLNWSIFSCLLILFFFLYFCLFKSLKSFRKVVWLTASLSYGLLIVLFIRCLRLPGSMIGIYHYITLKFEKFWNMQLWIEAYSTLLYSMGIGLGVHTTLASYNSYHNNVSRDCLIVVLTNGIASLFAGFMAFAFVGCESHSKGMTIVEYVNARNAEMQNALNIDTPTVATCSLEPIWKLLVVVTVILAGLSNSLGIILTISTGLYDKMKNYFYKATKYSNEIFTFVLLFCLFVLSLNEVNRNGYLILTFLDPVKTHFGFTFIILLQLVGVTRVYGIDRFANNLEDMLGHHPHRMLKVMWTYTVPLQLSIYLVLQTKQALFSNLLPKQVPNTFNDLSSLVADFATPAEFLALMVIVTFTFSYFVRPKCAKTMQNTTETSHTTTV